jgi:hypothetical protein
MAALEILKKTGTNGEGDGRAYGQTRSAPDWSGVEAQFRDRLCPQRNRTARPDLTSAPPSNCYQGEGSVRVSLQTKATLTVAVIIAAAAGGLLAADGPRRVSQSTEPPPASAPPETAGTAAVGTPAAVLDDRQITAVLGKNVRSKDDEDMGRIIDVIVSKDGQVRAAVIDFGGFLGVGSRKIAVDWNSLKFGASGKPDRITLELTRNQVRVVPEYKSGEPLVVLGAVDPTQARTPPPATPEK